MITHDGATGFRAEDAVDFSPIITLTRESLLRGSDGGIGVVIAVAVLSIILLALVSTRIVIGRFVVVRIPVVTVGVIVVRIPILPPWIESEVEDDPGPVDESAMMPVPDVIAAAIPIALPIG